MTTIHIVTRSASPFSHRGGLERAVETHASLLHERGYKVCLHTWIESEPPPRTRSPYDRIVSVPWKKIWPFKPSITFGVEYLLWTRRAAASLKACVVEGDIVHTHGASSCAAFGLSTAIPHLTNPHGLEEFTGLSVSTLLPRLITRRMSRAGASHAAAVISTDPSLTDRVVRDLRVQTSKVVLIPNVSTAEVSRCLPPRQDALNLVSVGRVEHNKGYDLLAEAVVLLHERSSLEVCWSHFGTGDTGSIGKLLSPLQGIQFTHHEGASDDEVRAALESGSLFVQPSRYEGSSLTTLEAMSAGAIVVGTPVGGIPDKVIDGVTGFLARDCTANAIADAIWAAQTSDRHHEISEGARDMLIRRYSASAVAESYVDIYRRLLTRSTN